MTSFNQWVDAFRSANLTITGVTRHYDEPPLSLNTADLPAAWPSIFAGGYDGDDWSCNELNEAHSMSFIIACEAVNQSRMPENYQLMVDLADAARTALNNIDVMTFIRPISIQAASINVAGNDYYGLTCTIEGSNSGV
jgi:hypothetical protein